MRFKLYGAQRVGDMLHSVLKGVGIVVHGINAPLVAGPMVGGVIYAVYHRVAHIEVARGQIYLGPQGHAAVLKLSGPHTFKQLQTLLLGTVPVRAPGGSSQVPAHFPHLLLGELADIGKALLYQLDSALVHLPEEVRSVIEAVPPVVSKPVKVLLYGLHILNILLGGIGVIHPQVTDTTETLRCAKVHINCLCVANVQVAVGFRRKPCVHLHTLSASPGPDILLYKLVYKICADNLRIPAFIFLAHDIPFFSYYFFSCQLAEPGP